MQEITPKQYAEWYGTSAQRIHKLLKEENWSKLPHIEKVKRHGRFYVLEVADGISKKSFKEIIPSR